MNTDIIMRSRRNSCGGMSQFTQAKPAIHAPKAQIMPRSGNHNSQKTAANYTATMVWKKSCTGHYRLVCSHSDIQVRFI